MGILFVLRSAAYTISAKLIPFHGRSLSTLVPPISKITEMTVREGSAEVKLPDAVFYNPVQEFNRDITIAVIRNFLKMHLREFIDKGIKIAASKNAPPEPTTYVGISILEALAASGLRSVRFANEIPLVCKITANDLDPEATKLISENAQRNNVSALVKPTCSDAVSLMLNSTSYADRFNVVDIDPYGTASPFLDSAVQCLYDGGLLCVTCTDMAVLCGATPGTAYGKYGGVAIKMTAQHEQGLRLLLYAIQQAASRHGKIIEPLLSLSIDFYARVFVRVWSSPGSVKHVAAKMVLVYSCTGCQVVHLQRLGSVPDSGKAFAPARGPPVGPQCSECGSPFAVAGPLWADSLHSVPFLHDLINALRKLKPFPKTTDTTEALEMVDFSSEFPIPEWLQLAPNLRTSLPAGTFGTLNRLIGMLTVASEELEDCPFYMQVDQLASIIRTSPPKMTDLRSAFLNAGYRVSFSHAATASLKTDAPPSFIWDVMCAWKRRVQATKAAAGSGSPSSQKEGKDKFMSLEDNTMDAEKQTELQSVEETATVNVMDQKAVKRKSQGKKHPPAESALRVEAALMGRPPNPRVDFTPHPNANPSSREEGLLRYQLNPLPNWGPKARPRSVKKSDSTAPKEPLNLTSTKQPRNDS